MESVKINLRKSENNAPKVLSEKSSQSLLKCPRSLRLLLLSTQSVKLQGIVETTWLVGTGLLTATGKPIKIATIDIFDKTHDLRFL